MSAGKSARSLVAAVVLIASITATAWLAVTYRTDRAHDAAYAEAGPAAATAAAAVLSYAPDTVTDDLARARSHLTGDFAAYFDRLGTDVVLPAARQRHMRSEATVTASSVVSATSDHAVALVFLSQVTTADDLARPTTVSSTLRLELTKVGHHWLVTELDSV
ncbi:hypothetical protein [Nocardia sp. NPDC005366]|uniref:hypothetical protein n=1 Tax=Nocardia sp. NPDC005366 TaxID=3156878 RepID=UPI0033BD931C